MFTKEKNTSKNVDNDTKSRIASRILALKPLSIAITSPALNWGKPSLPEISSKNKLKDFVNCLRYVRLPNSWSLLIVVKLNLALLPMTAGPRKQLDTFLFHSLSLSFMEYFQVNFHWKQKSRQSMSFYFWFWFIFYNNQKLCCVLTRIQIRRAP